MTPEIPVVVYRSAWSRARGLIGRPAPAPGSGVLIDPCRQVHTFFMSYPIDTVHLDKSGCVISILTLSPWRLGPWKLRSKAVLEMAEGEATRVGLAPGVRPNLIGTDTRASTRNSRV
ncbi:MAG: DUF192 domain-containing protein [Myxococcota bacterium]